jgi:hypothetical protein
MLTASGKRHGWSLVRSILVRSITNPHAYDCISAVADFEMRATSSYQLPLFDVLPTL